MKLIRPAPIDDAALIETNVDEPLPAYVAGTTYAAGALVRDDIAHRIYESTQAGNIGHALTDPAWWIDVGPTNRWAMFDTVNGTSTQHPSLIDVTIKPLGRIDHIGLLNVDAAQIQVTITDVADGVIFDETFSMVADSGVTDWYAYFYEPIIRKTDLIVANIQLYNSPTIRLQISSGGEPVSIGTVVVGQSKYIGDAQHGDSVGIIDRSRKDSDEFGNYQVVERPYSSTGDFRIAVEPGHTDEIVRLFKLYRATPLLWIGEDSMTSTAIFGFWKDWSAVFQYPTLHFFSLKIEGLT